MTRALVTSSKYSPGNLTPEALESLFVGRERVLTEILKRIAASALGKEKHFFLLIGQRGVGKTHFVHLLHQRLCSDPAYAKARKRLKIAFLNEEEWGVASFLDFLMRILRALAYGADDQRLRDRIEEIFPLHARDPDAALRTAQTLLVEYIGHSTLLLICENLVDLFDGLGEEGQKRWRALIQENPFWTIVATTPSLFSGVKLQRSPFYGFFTIRDLERLDFETAAALLEKKANVDGHQDLAAFLQTSIGRARARAVHHLAGGYHRVYIAMSEFLTRESLDDLVNPFMRMIDDLTPYYQDRIRQLASPQQRKIVEFLSQGLRPMQVKDVATRCLITQQTAAKQLGELTSLGFVKKTAVGRETYCELSEPLMRLCFEVKDTRSRHLRLFVDFLRRWFTSKELRSRFAALDLDAAMRRPFDHAHLGAAIELASSERTEPFLEALDEEARRCFKSRDYAGATEAQRRLVEERGTAREYAFLVLALTRGHQVEDALRWARKATEGFPSNPETHWAYSIALESAGRIDDAIAEIDRSIRKKPKDIKYLCLRGELLFAAGRFEAVLQNEAKLLRLESGHRHSHYMRSRALSLMGKVDEAEAIARRLIEEDENWVAGWHALGAVFFDAGRHSEALVAFDRGLAIDPGEVSALAGRCHALEQLRRYGELLESSRRLLLLRAGDTDAEDGELSALCGLGRLAEAEELARRLVAQRNRAPASLRALAFALISQHKAEEGARVVDEALSALPADGLLRELKVVALRDLRRYEEALAVSDESLRSKLTPDEAGRQLDVRSSVLLLMGRDREALEAALKARKLAPDRRRLRYRHMNSATAALGIGAGIEVLRKAVTANPDDDWLDSAVSEMLVIELRRRGPVAMAKGAAALRPYLAEWKKENVLASALTGLMAETATSREALVKLEDALPVLESALAGIEECQLPLQALSVMTRYARTGDETILLELPLELRTLMEPRLGETAKGE